MMPVLCIMTQISHRPVNDVCIRKQVAAFTLHSMRSLEKSMPENVMTKTFFMEPIVWCVAEPLLLFCISIMGGSGFLMTF